jgi:hypothetical protein
MYNFRYHLVTICSIFLALAIGLLLGAAITGSNLVRDTSQGLVDSLLEQFNEITNENTKLSQQLEIERPLAQQLLGSWQVGRLEGRTVVILASGNANDTDLTRQTAQLIAESGGVPVTVTVVAPEFGLTNAETTAALQQLLPAIDSEPYTTTLAKALVDEWTYDGLPFTITTIPGETTNSQGAEGPKTDATGATDADATAVDPAVKATGDTASGDNTSPQNEGGQGSLTLASGLTDHYPLTLKLVELGSIKITVSYDDFIARNASKMSTRLEEVWAEADAADLPYAVNGLVDMLAASNEDSSAFIADPVGLQAAFYVDNLGAVGDLPKYLWEPVTSPEPPAATNQGEVASDASDTDVEDAAVRSEYAVLAQASGRANGLVDAATQMALSCVTTVEDNTGKYSLIVLLSGADKGVYGSDRPAGSRFPT